MISYNNPSKTLKINWPLNPLIPFRVQKMKYMEEELSEMKGTQEKNRMLEDHVKRLKEELKERVFLVEAKVKIIRFELLHNILLTHRKHTFWIVF